jgi:hypothetical protein
MRTMNAKQLVTDPCHDDTVDRLEVVELLEENTTVVFDLRK